MRYLIALVLVTAAGAQVQNYQNLPGTSLNVGSITVTALSSPAAAPTVTSTCFATCTHTWSYVAADYLPDGTSNVGSSAGSTTTRAAILNSSAFNTVAHTCATNAARWSLWRTVSGGTPSSLGTTTSVTSVPCATASVRYTGWAGDTTTAPATNTTGTVIVGGAPIGGGTTITNPYTSILHTLTATTYAAPEPCVTIISPVTTDFTGAVTSQQVKLFTVPALWSPRSLRVEETSTITASGTAGGAAISALAVSIGTVGSATGYMTAFAVMGTSGQFREVAGGTSLATTATSTQDVQLQLTNVSANPAGTFANLTGGTITVRVCGVVLQ